MKDLYCSLDAIDKHCVVEGKYTDCIERLGAIYRHFVNLAIANSARARKIDIDHSDIRAAQVVDGDFVRAAERIEGDLFDTVQVHGDVGNVAGKQHPLAIRRNVDVLGNVGAAEIQRIDTSLTLDRIAAIAWVPNEDVVARAERATSSPRPPVTMSLPSPPMRVSAPSPPVIVSFPAPPSMVSLMWVGEAGSGGDDVIARTTLQDQSVIGALRPSDVDQGRETGHRDGCP